MGRRRKSPSDEKQEKGKNKEASDHEESEDEEGLDEFEDDGFIVCCDEDEEEEEENSKQTQKKKKKRKRRSSESIVLDDDDLELIRENKISGINQENMGDGKFKRLKKAAVDNEIRGQFSDEGGSLFDDMVEDEQNLSDDAEDDMADFIADEEVVYGERDSLRQRKFSEAKHSSSLLKRAQYSFGKAGPVIEHRREVLFESTEPDEFYKSDPFGQTIVDVAGKGNCLDDIDMPERMEILEDIVGSVPVDKISIEEESFWILSQLDSNIYLSFSENREEGKSCRLLSSLKREDIMRFLELHRAKKYDIPFIAMYRKEKCLSLLEDPEQDEAGSIYENDSERKPQLKWHKVLWIIRELDRKWLLLQKRKSTLMPYYNKRFEEECQTTSSDEEASFNKQLSDSITNMLKKAESEREIDDIDRKFNLHFPPVEEEIFNVGYKRPVKKSYYSKCSVAGLLSLACKFGNPEKFGFLTTLEKGGMEKQADPEESPEKIASIYKCATFETSEAVLKGARHMSAVQISSEIPLRKYIRSIYMDKALMSTSPTPKGNMVIDSYHQFAGIKWLQDKPLTKFKGAQWLIIQKAEEEKLLQVKIGLPDHTLQELTMTCNDMYLNVGEGTSTQLWNEQRKSILQDSISNFLLPSMEKEARALLTVKAKNWLLMEYGRELWSRVSVAPCQYKDNATAQEKGAAPKVMASCWGTGKPGTALVMLDSKGELVDVMHAGSLTLRSQSINDQQSRKNDQQRVINFLSNHQPHVIVIGAGNASCIRLRDAINEIISMMLEEHSEDASRGMKGRTTVVLGDEGLPRLYEDSEISVHQLPRQHGIVKRAVALGRYLLNPLAMAATLCGVKKEILSWKLNPLEQFLTSDEKLEIIEWVLADITNQVGIDINFAISHDWLSAPLQFVSGLGPRKAGILRRELLGGTAVRNRRDLTKCGLNKMKVFCNAVGFLQVSCNEPIFADTVANILDNTRIHPESYHLAEEFARAVYRHYKPDDDATQVNAIEFIHDDPKLLQAFDVNDYASRLEVETGECKRETLYDIKVELLDGFKDPRRPYKEPTQDEAFYMITGETGDIPIEGKRVQAIVRNVQSKQAFCVLDSGLTGVLFREDFSDETDDISLTDKLHEGVVLNCKIKLIDKNRYRVNLTCKASELKSDGNQSFHDMDPYYCQGKINFRSQQGKADKEELENKHFVPRKVFHPHFQNITADQAKEFLADKAVGDYIFHPSCRGPGKLTLTVKIFDGLCVHKDIVECGKTQDMNSLLALGKTLKIGEEIFEDIDKVMERYVNPLVVHLKAMLCSPKFKGSKAEVDGVIKLEKEEYPKRIVYGFGLSYDHPGTFILSYIRNTNLHHEFIGIHPKGFKFRKQIFESIEHMVAYFQNHIYDSIVLAKKPRTDGSHRESLDGSWRSSVYQRKQSTDTNGRGDGRGRGRGRNRGRSGGRGCGRGRGLSPKSGSHDDCAGDSSNKSKGGSGLTSAKRESGSNDGNFRDSGGSNYHDTNYESATRQWGTDGTFGISKSWDTGGPSEVNASGTTNFGHQNSHAWGSAGNDQAGGCGWSHANSSGWASNIGKSRGEDGPTEGNSRETTTESGMHTAGGNQGVSNDCGAGRGRGRGRGRRGKGRGMGRSQGDGRGCGREHERDNSSYNGGWGNTRTGSYQSDSSGWANAKSSGRNDNIAKSWGVSARGEGSGRETTNFFQQNNHETGMHAAGNNQRASNDCGWGQGKGRRGSQVDNQGRGRERNQNGYRGRWSRTGCDHTGGGGGGGGDGGWAADWGSNNGKNWSEGGVGEGIGSGTSNFSYQNSHESGKSATANNQLVSNGCGWGRGQGQGRERGWSQGNGWVQRGRHNQSCSGQWGNARSDPSAGGGYGGGGGGGGGWGRANSSDWGGKMEGSFDGGNCGNKKKKPEIGKKDHGTGQWEGWGGRLASIDENEKQ